MRERREDRIKVAVLDFGSSAIKLAVAEKESASSISQKQAQDEFFRLIYLDSEPSEGAIQRGVIFNLSETSEKVRQLLARAKNAVGSEISHLYANISGQGLHSLLIKQAEEYDAPREITQADIERLWGNIEEHEGTYFLNADFARFLVNGNPVLRPVGVKAVSLQVSIQTVVTDHFVADNVEEVLEHKLGLEVAPYLVGVVELSKRVLTAEQKRIGSAFIDFGAETTTVCYFNHSVLESLRVIPMGGQQVTYDLTSLDISPEEAERIKIANGSLTLDTSDKEELVVKAPDMLTDKRVSRYHMNQYIEARVHEIVDNVKAVISRAKGVENDFQIPGGMVISGGASKLTGLVEYLKEKMGGELSVKQVGPAFFADGDNQELITNPEFHTLYAMLCVANEDIARQQVEKEESTPEPVTVPESTVTPEADSLSDSPGVLPFDKQELESTVEPSYYAKKQKEKEPKRKRNKGKRGSFWEKMQDLFSMADDETIYSDDED